MREVGKSAWAASKLLSSFYCNNPRADQSRFSLRGQIAIGRQISNRQRVNALCQMKVTKKEGEKG
jgi:hypothetical protein